MTGSPQGRRYGCQVSKGIIGGVLTGVSFSKDGGETPAFDRSEFRIAHDGHVIVNVWTDRLRISDPIL
jgi:hypothetical protein